jgi:hypothetical protein
MNHTESTVSANIRLIGENGADIQLTIRSGATTDEVQAVIDTMAKAMVYAKEKYHLSPKPPVRPLSPANGNGATGTAPICPKHDRPMMDKGRGWFCPAIVAPDDGTGRPVYCKQKS